ncbi:AVAST type 4 anti-phage nuclease Avs4 [Elizabethkingia meningoseptica]|uniref:AVAST type 4 anti-phage nuclease Avs4 n=1 Tax=Elizabethkingia meningoseptica TaxID=238 RepID=UPI00093758C2|nr:AVAST type 4 anti-phage nuclease Avs4 [Elizabethkingia meningoseptica]
MNWNIFNLKYDNRETWAFEQMSYLLFCAEFNNRIGLFRYKNQTGTETNIYEKEGIYYGFQSKYYLTNISQNKDDIIDSIKKAKKKNNQLNIIYLYLNQELSESSKKDKKKPQYQIAIEEAGKEIGLLIEWRVPSHLELQLSLTENKYINDIFFSLESNENELIDDIRRHNENILRAIQTEIIFDKKHIKVNRDKVLTHITESLDKKQNIIISGEGGCGKTAILKEFYIKNGQTIPICIYKATELNINHINDLFRFNNNFTINQFIKSYESESHKIFIIDSAEKLSELSNNEILNNLIQTLIENDWNLIFTTRYSYLNDLSFHIKENYQLACNIIDIQSININELKEISNTNNFSLPNNLNFLERLTNLFYLQEYIKYYPTINKQSDFSTFVDLLWKKRIQNTTSQKDNLHLERDKCLIYIAKQRCETGLFYINPKDLSQKAIRQLQQDEILGYDDIHNGFFITHDIYEEWALEKIISRNYANYINIYHFFQELGSSLPLRRAFRLWLSGQLANKTDNINNFVNEAFENNIITQYWKDELLISVLLSDYSEIFFELFEKEAIKDNFLILKRILFLLQIACNDISTIDGSDMVIPKGKGWETIINFIYKYKNSFFEKNYELVLPLLANWCNRNRIGKTTRSSGLLALSILNKTENSNKIYINDKIKRNILKIISNASNEIKEELSEIFEKVIINGWFRHNDPYEDLCSTILEKPYLVSELIRNLPLEVLRIADILWRKNDDDDNRYDSWDTENQYGLVNKHTFGYFPASAFQTPIYALLQYKFIDTLSFIINFTNRSIDNYINSNYEKEEISEITIYINQQNEVKQYLSKSLWEIYRGTSSPVTPDLLQSIHMALEKILLERIPQLENEIAEQILLTILSKSRSTSLTAIVCSVVNAYPNKLFNVALILFKTLKLFSIDRIRCINESQAKTLYSIGTEFKPYSDERLITCEDKHRNKDLESLFVSYQFLGVEGFCEEKNDDFIKRLHEIIDQHIIDIQSESENEKLKLNILLARMDRRKMKPKIKEYKSGNTIIELNPQLPLDLREYSRQVIKEKENTFKYMRLRLWSDFLYRKRYTLDDQNYAYYDEDPLKALEETKELITKLENSELGTLSIDQYIPYSSCSNLMINHKDRLSENDRTFCKEVIIKSILRLFSDDHHYYISDGVETSIHAIPSLIIEYPEEAENFIKLMIQSLFNKREVGNRRICDYVIESLYESKLWELDFSSFQKILLGFIMLKPIYNNIYNELRQVNRMKSVSITVLFEEFKNRTNEFSFSNIVFDAENLNSLHIDDLETIILLIPINTKNTIHLYIYEKAFLLIAPDILKSQRDYSRQSFESHSNIYLLRHYVFKRFAYFILERETIEVERYLNAFIPYLNPYEETAAFLDEIVGAADKQDKQVEFWNIWNILYPKIIEICSTYDNISSLHKVIKSYLLAWDWWKDGIIEWHNLERKNLIFYTNIVRDIAYIPTVLYSIAKILNSIASKFQNEGIDLVYNIISNNPSLNTASVETQTLNNLELFMRKFIYMNKDKIKREIRLKNKAILILSFMIERGSTQAYLLRENIL